MLLRQGHNESLAFRRPSPPALPLKLPELRVMPVLLLIHILSLRATVADSGRFPTLGGGYPKPWKPPEMPLSPTVAQSSA